MKAFAWILMVWGALWLISIGVAEWSGWAYLGNGRPNEVYVNKRTKPDKFHDAISIHALFGVLSLLAGIAIWEAAKRSEESDPSSPNYTGSKALDDWSEALDMEAERRGLKKPKQDKVDPPV